MELASLLTLSDLAEQDVPFGYVMLAALFSWEAECQFDGWGAFGNISDQEFQRLCSFYSQVGLEDEAKSLAEQMRSYKNDPEDLNALNLPFSSTEHNLSGDLDRLEYLTQYFCDNADKLLYTN